MMYIGVDPGKSGGVAFISEVGAELFPMPPTEMDILSLFGACSDKCFAYIEKVWGHVGGQGNPGSAMFTFGHNYGSLRMALMSQEIPFEEVTPRTWQKEFGITPRKPTESKGEFKNRIKAKSQQLFPRSKITLKTCDALLIGEYCKRVQGEL